MRSVFRKVAWSPYVVGAGIGILSWITFLLMFKALATSTAFVHLVGFLVSLVSMDHVSFTPYFSKYVEFRPVIDWQFMLVIGLFVGAWTSSRLAPISISYVPYLWGKNFGFVKRTRIIGALIGGFLVLFGARLAGGCTLGHGISGGLQFVTLSWLFTLTVFVTGIISAHILYRNK